MITNIIYSGITNDFFENAFGNADATLLTPTRLEARDLTTGYTSVFTGSGFAAPTTQDGPPSGTMNSVAVFDASGNPVISISGVSWDLTVFARATDSDLSQQEQDSALFSLLNLQPITVDASGANIGANLNFGGTPTSAGTTQPVTILGSPNADRFAGGENNDTINPGGTPAFDGDVVFGSRGSDTINLRDMGPNSYFDLTYEEIEGPITVAVNGNAGTMTVAKTGSGTDTILNVGNALRGEGLGVAGSSASDTFNLNSGAGGWMEVNGLQGNDTFNLTLDGTIRMNYSGSYAGNSPFTGVAVNLATGTVSKDGFGNQDRINILGGTGRLEFRGTDNTDTITGSDRDERFILRGGNDELDGGGGFDTLRYDRSIYRDTVFIDTMQGTVNGNWTQGSSTIPFTHFISNIEGFRGTDFYDNMVGSAASEHFIGNGGNDLISGFGGRDTLEGGVGDDTITGGDDNDRILGGSGDDRLDPRDNSDFDQVDPGSGNDQIDASGVFTGYLDITHNDLANSVGLTVSVDMNARESDGTVTGRIDKGAQGVTTIRAADVPLTADGLGIAGSDLNDTFNVAINGNSWLAIKGGGGTDTYNFSNMASDTGGIVRMDFSSSNLFESATQGLNINLATRTIANDGFGNQEQITGTATSRFEIRGTDNADVMVGSEANDRFIGQGGNDNINGGAGFDLLRFDRNEISAGVTVDLGVGTATGTWGGQAFAYTLSNIEGIRGTGEFSDSLIGSTRGEYFEGRGGNDLIFGDGAAAAYFGTAAANQVYRLYQATLDRAPDITGHYNWTSRIATGERTLEEVASGFVGSPEFTSRFPASSNADFVTLLYNNVLNSTPDDRGLARWTGELEGGASRAQVVLGFSDSPQFVSETNAMATRYAMESLTTTWSDDVFRLYQATLDRAPDEKGLNRWTGELAEGTSTLEQVSAGFVGSPEFTSRFPTSSNTDFVTLLYNNVLNSTPDQAGLDRWTGELEGGASRAEVVLGFSQSPQFTAQTAPDVKQWMRDQGVHDRIEADTGINTVAGGQYADVFIFNAGETGRTTVADFEAWDYLQLSGFGYADLASAKTQMTQIGADVLFSDQDVDVVLRDTALDDIQLDTFLDTFQIV